jgi:hypothetical protein
MDISSKKLIQIGIIIFKSYQWSLVTAENIPVCGGLWCVWISWLDPAACNASDFSK